MKPFHSSQRIPAMMHPSQRETIFAQAPGLQATEALFDTINDILFCVKDTAGRYVAVNEAFIRSTRLPHRADLLGRTAREVFPEILAAGYEQQDQEVFTKGISVRDRLEMITQADGNVGWFVSQKVVVKSLQGKMIALAGISRKVDAVVTEGTELGTLAHALDQLHQQSHLPIKIEQLAKKAKLSPSQFQRRVKQITGLTPRQILTKSRIDHAAELLRDTQQPLASIATDCGFYDQATFSRQFREATGLTPGEYRRAFKNG